MPIIRTTRVSLGQKANGPIVEQSFVTDDEWSNLSQSMMRMGAKRSHAGKVFTLVGKDFVRVTEWIFN